MQLQGQPGVFVGGSAGIDASLVCVRERVHYARSLGVLVELIVLSYGILTACFHRSTLLSLHSSRARVPKFPIPP
jgi:hypothetical protein